MSTYLPGIMDNAYVLEDGDHSRRVADSTLCKKMKSVVAGFDVRVYAELVLRGAVQRPPAGVDE